MRDRRAERHHHAVAENILNSGVLDLDHPLDELRQALNEAERGLLAETLGECSEPHHVGEENHQLPAFCFHASVPAIPETRNIWTL